MFDRASPLHGLPRVRRPRGSGRSRHLARFACFVAFAGSGAFAGSAWSAGPPLRLVGDSLGCPNPEAVAARLRALVPGVHVALGAVPGPSRSTVLLWNEGTQYSITAAGHERVINGQRQSCAERARAAAVVIVLALFPPDATPPPGPAPLPPPVRALPTLPAPLPDGPRLRAKPPSLQWAMEIGALFDSAPGAAGGLAAAPGLGVRLQLGRGRWGVGLGFAAVAWSSAQYGELAVRTRRFPLDLSARARLGSGPALVALDLGLVLGIVGFSAPGLVERADATRLEVGARIAAALHWRIGRRFAPFIAVETAVLPRPFELAFAPAGVVGESPHVRLTVSAGVAFGLGQ